MLTSLACWCPRTSPARRRPARVGLTGSVLARDRDVVPGDLHASGRVSSVLPSAALTPASVGRHLRRGRERERAARLGRLEQHVGLGDAAVGGERVVDGLDRVGDQVRLHVDAAAARRPRAMLTFALAKPSGPSRLRTSATCAVRPCVICTCHDVPPSKSMPKLRPRANNATKLSSESVPERIAQRRLCLMNWKLVRSW